MDPDLAARLAPLRSNPHLCDVATRPLLTPDECGEIVTSLTDEWKPMHVQSAPGGEVLDDVRRGRQQPIPGGDNGPLATRIIATIAEMNDETFGFRLLGVESHVQVLRYRGETGDRYVGHMDLSSTSSLRKLSFSLLLSDPATFEGGDLCFGDPLAESRVQGTLSVFPSYLPHEVMPVTAGTRDVIVGWMVGPPFS